MKTIVIDERGLEISDELYRSILHADDITTYNNLLETAMAEGREIMTVDANFTFEEE